MHARCRCIIAASIDRVKLDGNVSYSDWKAKYVEKSGVKSDIQVNYDVLIKERQKLPLELDKTVEIAKKA